MANEDGVLTFLQFHLSSMFLDYIKLEQFSHYLCVCTCVSEFVLLPLLLRCVSLLGCWEVCIWITVFNILIYWLYINLSSWFCVFELVCAAAIPFTKIELSGWIARWGALCRNIIAANNCALDQYWEKIEEIFFCRANAANGAYTLQWGVFEIVRLASPSPSWSCPLLSPGG